MCDDAGRVVDTVDAESDRADSVGVAQQALGERCAAALRLAPRRYRNSLMRALISH